MMRGRLHRGWRGLGGVRGLRVATPLTRQSARLPALPRLPGEGVSTGKRSFATSRVQRSEQAGQEQSTGPSSIPREEDEVDVCIVGGGPAGLSAAIRLRQLAIERGLDDEFRVLLLEKGPEIGSHILSGAVVEPRALDELFPDWRESPPDDITAAGSEHMKFLTQTRAFTIPEPPQMHNKGNYIMSLSNLTKWLAERAEELGVEIYPGFAGAEVLYDESGAVCGVATGDAGISRSGEMKDTFERGMAFKARATLFAEGARGSLSKQLIKKFKLREGRGPQTYGIGLKEVWEVPEENWREGEISHSLGYPLDNSTYGGGFMYHFGRNLVSVGLVVGLDYPNPYLSPYLEFQRMKHHPIYESVLRGGKCLVYGARALNEGGWQSIPKLDVPGGALIGCAAGFLNVPKIKGTHTAMKSGMLAAETVMEAVAEQEADAPLDLGKFEPALRDSWVGKELYEVRNLRPSFHNPLGNVGGIMYSGIDSFILKGRVPWTFKFNETDAAATRPASKFQPIAYPKPDGEISFDILTSVSRTGTMHDEDEPIHLVDTKPAQRQSSYAKFKGVEGRFCPASVYEWVDDASTETGKRFQINAQNCIHCKTCDIKDPLQNIDWTVPQGGEGPKYSTT